MVGRRTIERWVIALMCLCTFAVARAQAQENRSKGVVSIEGELDPSLSATLDELLGRVDLSLAHGRVPQGAVLVARVRIVPNEGGVALTITDGLGRGVRVERAVTNEGSPALFRETVAHVILGAVEPIAAMLDTPVEEPTPPHAPVVAPVEVSPARPPIALTAALGAGPRWLAPGRTGAMFEAGLFVHLPRALTPGFGLRAAGLVPRGFVQRDVDVSLHLWSLRAAFSLRPLRLPRFALDVGVQGGFDLASLDVTAAPVPAKDSTRMQPVLGPSLRATLSLMSRLSLWAAFVLDVDLAPRRWVVAHAMGATELTALSRLRPSLGLGLARQFDVGRAP